MISINRLHIILKALLNTEGRGNVKPTVIDMLIHASVVEIYEELLFEVNRIINRQNRGLINGALESTTEKIREKIQHYLENKTVDSDTNVFKIPKEVRYFDTIHYKNTFVELCKNHKEFLLSQDTVDEDYPIGLKTTDTITVLPQTVREVSISYLRNPKPAKWTFRKLNDVEVFDPSKTDFADVDIHSSEEYDLITRVALKLGVNLKEKDIQEVMQREELREFNEEVTN